MKKLLLAIFFLLNSTYFNSLNAQIQLTSHINSNFYTPKTSNSLNNASFGWRIGLKTPLLQKKLKNYYAEFLVGNNRTVSTLNNFKETEIKQSSVKYTFLYRNYEINLKKEFSVNRFTFSPFIGYSYFVLNRKNTNSNFMVTGSDSVAYSLSNNFNTKLQNLHQFNMGLDLGFKITNRLNMFVRYVLPINNYNINSITTNYSFKVNKQNSVGTETFLNKVNNRQFGIGLYYQLGKSK